MASIKGVRSRHVVTMNPSSASPGEEIYARIPKLAPGLCLLPGSLQLLFDFKAVNSKFHFLNNLLSNSSPGCKSNLLVNLLVYDNSGKSDWGTNKNLWLSKSRRTEMVQCGVANTNLKKLISKDNSGSSSGDAAKFYCLRHETDDIAIKSY